MSAHLTAPESTPPSPSSPPSAVATAMEVVPPWTVDDVSARLSRFYEGRTMIRDGYIIRMPGA